MLADPVIHRITFACITGKITAEKLKNEHPLEYAALMEQRLAKEKSAPKSGRTNSE